MTPAPLTRDQPTDLDPAIMREAEARRPAPSSSIATASTGARDAPGSGPSTTTGRSTSRWTLGRSGHDAGHAARA